MSQPNQLQGYWLDNQGRLVPEQLVAPIDRARDDLVRDLVAAARPVADALATFKARAHAEIAAFVSLSAQQYQVHIGGKKGNITLTSYNGCMKVQRAIEETMVFDERLQAAKALIDECLLEWTAGARPEVLAIIQDAFRVDHIGQISTGRILALRRLNIADERWQRAMNAIAQACLLAHSKAYIRIYERESPNAAWRAIPLHIADVAV